MNELVLAFLYTIRQAAQFIYPKMGPTLGGNIDPLFFLAVFYLYESYQNRKISKKIILIILSLAIYSFLQFLWLPSVDIFRLFINISKIALCISIMFFMAKRVKSINLHKLVISISALYVFLTFLALTLMRNDIMWSMYDLSNKYKFSRLKLFYLEPSELGFHIMIIMIFLVGYFLVSKNRRTRLILFVGILMNIFVLFYTLSFGAIAIGTLSIAVMLVVDWVKNRTKQKNWLYFGIIISAILIFAIMVYIKAPIAKRLLDTLQGKDESNWYRVDVSFKVVYQTFLDYKGIGIGFGNMNRLSFVKMYHYLGVVQVLVNAIPYFIVEGGIYAFGFLTILLYKLIKAVVSSDSIIKIGLLVFLIIYQIFGSHFTNPLIWTLYGLILSTFSEHDERDFEFEKIRDWIKLR